MSLFRPWILLACVLGLSQARAQGSYTARKALEVFTRTVPGDVSGQIVAIVGFDGATEPAAWSFLVRQPSSGGSRLLEYQVQDGAIKGPRTLPPEEAPAWLNRPLPSTSLPVDSHDVARIVDDDVIQQGVVFSRIDYQLCWREKGPEPLWTATLVGAKGETLGHLFVSSISGEVTHRAFYFNFPRLPSPAKDQAATGSSRNSEAPGNRPAAPRARGLFHRNTAPNASEEPKKPGKLELPRLLRRP